MVVKYALAALFGFCILTASASVSAAPGYSDSQTACIDTCRKANACHGGPGAHDGSTRPEPEEVIAEAVFAILQ
jgi:hypothetical protein